MIGASKILTVSYGTFSCTLEGFDEPFSTMKAIAEYFRDLAAEDRYFGAEPPTPDAEMLHRIAEREIHRRVEAKISRNGVVLRPEGMAEEAPAPVPAAAPQPIAAEAPAPQPAAVAPAAARTPVAETPAAAAAAEIEDSIAAKLRRIRAVVAEAQAAPVANAAIEAAYEDEEPEAGLNGYAEPMDDDFGFVLDLDSGPDVELAEAAAPEEAPEAPAEVAEDATMTPEPAPESEVMAETAEVAEPAEAVAEAALQDFVSEELVSDVAETFAAGELDASERIVDEAEEAAEDYREEDILIGFEEEEAEAGIAGPEAADQEPAGAPAPDAAKETVPATIAGDAVETAEEATGEDDTERLIADLTSAATPAPAREPLVLSAADAVASPEEMVAGAMGVEAEASAGADEMAEAAIEAEAEWDDTAAEWQDDTAEDAAPQTGEPAEFDARIAGDETDDDLAESDLADLRDALTADEEVGSDVSAWGVDDEEDLRAVLTDETGGEAGLPLADDTAEAAEAAFADAASDAEDNALAETAGYDEDEDDIAAEPEPRSTLSSLLARAKARVLHTRTADPDTARHEAETPATPEAAQDDSAILAGIEAAVEAVEARADAAATAADDTAEPARSSAEAKALLQGQAEEGGEVERLMEEANTKLEGAESRRRFSAISHLKAAVAATVADRLLKSKDAPAETIAPLTPEIDRYRDDLSHAVRPRRPEVEPTRTTLRPTAVNRPTPLVLVSEQRVDRDIDSDDQSLVRPRRVSAGNLALSDDDSDGPDLEPLSPEEARSFTEFAERLGARSLPELLEAAAVYTATIEGLPDFSRPHLLRQVTAAADTEDYSREDCLRSFGTLLRQGKIQKVQRGRFSVTDASTFMTEARRAAR